MKTNSETLSLIAQARTLEEQNQFDEAEARLKRVITLREDAHQPSAPIVAGERKALAQFYERRGRDEDAERLLKLNVDFAKTQPLAGREFSGPLEDLAVFYEKRRRFGEAEQIILEAAASVDRAALRSDPFSRIRLAMHYVKRSDFEKADAVVANILESEGNAIREMLRIEDDNSRTLALYQPAFVIHHLKFLAELYDQQGRAAEAERIYLQRLAWMEALVGPAHRESAARLEELANFYKARERYAEATSTRSRIIAIHEKSARPGSSEIAEEWEELAGLHRIQWQFEEAEQLLKRALAVHENLASTLAPSAKLQSVEKLAESLRAKGNEKAAGLVLEQAARLRAPASLTGVGRCQADLARLYREQKRFDEAEALFRTALETYRKVYGPHELPILDVLINLKDLLHGLGRLDEANAYLDEVELLLRQTLDEQTVGGKPETPSTAMLAYRLALLYRDRGRHEEAASRVQRVLAFSEIEYGPTHRYTATVISALADINERQGRAPEAEALFSRALGIRQASLGADHSLTRQTRKDLERTRAHVPREAP